MNVHAALGNAMVNGAVSKALSGGGAVPLTRVANGSVGGDANVMGSMGPMGSIGLIGSLGPLANLNSMGSVAGVGGQHNGAANGNNLNQSTLLAQHIQQQAALRNSSSQMRGGSVPQPQSHHHHAMAAALAAAAVSGVNGNGGGNVSGGMSGIAGGAFSSAGIGTGLNAMALQQQQQALAAMTGGNPTTGELSGTGTGDALNHARISAQYKSQRENVESSRGRQR